MSKKKGTAGKRKTQVPVDRGRRKLIILGAGTLAAGGTALAGYKAGWFTPAPLVKTVATPGVLTILPPEILNVNPANARRAADEMIEHYARGLDNPSALIHAVRAFGRDFKRADGSSAVDFLCGKFAAEREVNGKRYVYFVRDAEVHDNSFLKTFLEAGVSFDQPVIAGGNEYTLRDVAESAKALLRFDPQNLGRYDATLVHDHLPWGLISFSFLIPPTQPVWTNAYGEKINLEEVIDRSLLEFERTSSLAEEALARGQEEPPEFRETIKKYSCFGLHSMYGFLSCLKHGYSKNNLAERSRRLLETVSYRLKGDQQALEKEYNAEAKGSPLIVVQGLYVRALIKLYGHAFESINYVRLHKLFPFSPGQEQRFKDGRAALEEAILKMRGMDWNLLRQTVNQMLGPGKGDVFISDIIISLGHAARGIKLMTRSNPDAAA